MAPQKQSAERKAQLDRRKQEDARFTYRVLITFGLAAVLLFASIRLSGWIAAASPPDVTRLIKILALSFFFLTLLAAAAALTLRLATAKRTAAAVLGYVSAVSAIVLFSLLFLRRFPSDGLWPLCVILLGAALIYLLYFIYPREFSLLAVLIGGGALGFWFLRRMFQTDMYGTISAGRTWPARATLPVVIFAAAIAASVLLLLLLRSRKGKLGPFQIFPHQTHYSVLLAACIFFAAGLVSTLIFGWAAAWGLMIACFVFLFIAAIYYTSKLM